MLVLSILWHLGLAALAPSSISTSASPVTLNSFNNTGPTFIKRANPSDASSFASLSSSHLTQINLSQTLWSSVFLVFGFAWIAVHPNYPSPYDSPWMKIRRRLMLVLWAVFLPEMMLYWSVRQWYGARNLWNTFKDKGWSITDAHFLQMGGLLLAPVRQEGPDGKPRLYTLTFPVLDAIYKVYSRNEGIVEPVVASNTETGTAAAPQSTSGPNAQASEAQTRSEAPTSSTSPIPTVKVSPPPDPIELTAFESPSPPSTSSRLASSPSPAEDVSLDEYLQHHASSSTQEAFRRPVSTPFPDIDNFAPPPDVIEAPPPPPQPREEFIDLRLEDADLGPILAAVHANLPSCLPVLRSRDVPTISATKPLLQSNYIASTFAADPVLATLVGMQLVWFLSGCIARIVLQGWRELLLLEVVVLAYLAMYAMMIAAWWDKPAIGVGAEPVKVVIMGEVPHKRRTKKELEEEGKKKKRKSFREAMRSERSKDKKRAEEKASDKGKGVDRSGVASGDIDGERPSSFNPTNLNDEHGLGIDRAFNNTHLQVPPFDIPREPDYPSVPSGATTPPTNASNNRDDDTILVTIWNGFNDSWWGFVFFRLDRVFELCLKATGYDRWSREYRISSNLLYSNIFTADSGAARTWREGRRHRRRVQANARRVGLAGGTNQERESVAGLIGADGYPFHFRGGPLGRSGRAWSDQESGVSADVRRRREAGSGGQSRLATFYTFVPEAGYHSALWEGNIKVMVGLLCGLVFGGIHLLGIAFREVPGEESLADAFTRGTPSFPSHAMYVVCTALLVVSPIYFAFCGLKLSDKYGYEDRIELAITIFLLEMLAIPLLFLYIPARLGVIVVALLQLVRRVDVGLEVVRQALANPAGPGFDGFSPVGAWWLDFIPHFS